MNETAETFKLKRGPDEMSEPRFGFVGIECILVDTYKKKNVNLFAAFRWKCYFCS